MTSVTRTDGVARGDPPASEMARASPNVDRSGTTEIFMIASTPSKGITMSDYAHPEVLVSTDWVQENLGKPGVRLIEVDVDTKAYDAGHVPGAVALNWETQLQDQVSRDILSKAQFEALLGAAGVNRSDTVVLYGDNNNWFAAYAFWLFKISGHEDVRLMNGGRVKWLNEDDKKLVVDVPAVKATKYAASEADLALRARVSDVLRAVESNGTNLVDVRSPDEFSGKVIAPPGMSETAQRGGHIPGAKSVPWATAVAPDGTFKSAAELKNVYVQTAGVDPQANTIAYCRIGERSSHTWFVLRYLLGLPNVRNYDGSWTEYGSMVGLPIER
jgi:thiosulfate/3-mercaptopyruvate sulfurtransferase